MNTIEILEAAKAKIANPESWMKGYYARDTDNYEVLGNDPRAVCFCSLGALENITNTVHCSVNWPSGPTDYLHQAVKAVSSSTHIADYNDTHTHEEVMAVWDKAIELAKADVLTE